jgi:nucleoid-associated protein Lsr2
MPLGGAEYETDLSTSNATAFRRQLTPFTEHARKLARDSGAGPSGPYQAVSAARTSEPGRKQAAITVSERGRIPASIVEQYEAAIQGS